MAYKTIEDTIGNTPLIQLVRLPGDDEIRSRDNVILEQLETNVASGLIEGPYGIVDDQEDPRAPLSNRATR